MKLFRVAAYKNQFCVFTCKVLVADKQSAHDLGESLAGQPVRVIELG